MSEECKTRLRVQEIIRKNILSMLDAMNMSGWDVMEFAQANFQKADKVILLNCIRTERVGWQDTQYSVSTVGLDGTDSWIEQQTWQIHVILKRKGKETTDDILSEDMSSYLMTWFNGRGCDLFRNNGMANLRIDHDNILVYNDDSDLYQKRAVFSLKVQIPKMLKFKQDSIDALLPKIKPV